MAHLCTPHIPLGLPLEEAVAILQTLGHPTQDDSDQELCYRVDTPLFSLAVYPRGGVVAAVWYDDPTGRDSESGRTKKVEAYLSRFGALENWERRLDNGWMHYWFNPSDHAQMVYGLHRDVIRFNQYTEHNA